LRSHFIHRSPSDPRPAWVQALQKSLPSEGSVLVYSKVCEENVLKNGEMATCEYQRVTHEAPGPVTREDRDAVYRGLEVYCDQDSWGQHELVDVIQGLSGTRIALPAAEGLSLDLGLRLATRAHPLKRCCRANQ
jgi:hypothetical protein